MTKNYPREYRVAYEQKYWIPGTGYITQRNFQTIYARDMTQAEFKWTEMQLDGQETLSINQVD